MRALLKDAARRPLSFQFACAIALSAALPVPNTFGQDYYQQQQRNAQFQFQAYQQQQQYEQQQRQQQETQRQQQYQETLRQNQRYYDQQQQQNRQAQEESNRRQQNEFTRLQEEEQRRNRERLDWSPVYDDSVTSNGSVEPAHPGSPSPDRPSDQLSDDDRPVSASSHSWLSRFVSLVALMLLCIAIGAFATMFVYLRHNPAAPDRPHTFEFTLSRFNQQVADAANHIQVRARATVASCWCVLRQIIGNAKLRLVKLIPPRRLVLRFSCFVLGISLMACSLFGFANDEVLTGFTLLTIGYAIVTVGWLLPRHTSRVAKEPRVSEEPRVSKEVVTSEILSIMPKQFADIRQPAVSTPHVGKVDGNRLTPSIEMGEAAAGCERRVDHAHLREETVPLERLLYCGHCVKQFHVSGQGEVAVRLIPCPHCGVALQRADGKSSSTIDSDIAWLPIISVYCEQCHGLIDVPYVSIGKTISCARCSADLFVPDTESRVKQLQHLCEPVK